MRLRVVLAAVALLGAFLPRGHGRALQRPGALLTRLGEETRGEGYGVRRGVLVRLGEEYFLRLDSADQRTLPPALSLPPEAAAHAFSTTVNRALQLRLARSQVGDLSGLPRQLTGRTFSDPVEDDSEEARGRRSEEPPISLDLTFHLLREVLEMARAEQLARQANSNRKMMDTFGK